MLYCSLEQKSTKAFLSLSKMYDETTLSKYICEAMAVDGTPSEGFTKWYKDRYNKEPNFNTPQSRKMASDIREYYYFKVPNARATVKDQYVGKLQGYVTDKGRTDGIKYLRYSIARQYIEDKLNNKVPKEDRKQYYINKARTNIKNAITRRIMDITGKTEEEVKKDIYGKRDIRIIDEVFESENATFQDKNLYALFKESFNGTRLTNDPNKTVSQDLFDTVFMTKELRAIEKEKTEEEKYESELDNEVEEGVGSNDEQSSNEETKDETIKNLDNHAGEFKTFEEHIPEDISVYLAMLPVLKSSQPMGQTKDGHYIWDYDYSNDIGQAKAVGAHKWCEVFYDGYTIDYTSKETMIESMHRNANNMPGFGALEMIAKDCERDPQFALKFFRVFRKEVSVKTETVVDGSSSSVRVRNVQSDKITALKYKYRNSLANSLITTDFDYLDSMYEDIMGDGVNAGNGNAQIGLFGLTFGKKDIKAKNPKAEAKLLERITKLVQSVIPTVDEQTIAYYVRNHRENDVINTRLNYELIISNMKTIIQGVKKTQLQYEDRHSRIIEAHKINDLLTKSKDKNFEGREKVWEQYSNGEFPSKSDYINLSSIYAEHYVEVNADNAAQQIATLLADAVPVETELNSVNVEGNKSSNVLNDCLLTNVKRLLRSKDALNAFAKIKFLSNQYNFSNILMESPINPGLFRKDDKGNIVVTDYAHQLIKINLFNGATNRGNKKSVMYSKMSTGDYIATGYINFFQGNEVADMAFKAKNMAYRTATYFMRTPSDAPKNYQIVTTKYDTKGLYTIGDEVEANRIVNDKVNNIRVLTPEERRQYMTINEYSLSTKQAVSLLTSKKPGDLTLKSNEFNHKTDADGNVSVYGVYGTGGNSQIIVVKGKAIQQSNGTYTISNPQLVGTALNGYSWNQTLLDSVKNHFRTEAIKNNEIKFGIDRKHSVFRLFKKQFIQELTDAHNALKLIFDTTSDGMVINSKQLKDIAKDKNRLYKQYHYKGDIIENGKLTGNVFHSDRFTVLGINYLEKAFNNNEDGGDAGHINFLYGGPSTNSYLHVDRNGVPRLTAEQNPTVDKLLEDYIKATINVARNQISNYTDLLNGAVVDDEHITDFALNYALAFMSFNDMFEGDSKFYKNPQDELKRAKEVQGSGVPFGIVNTNLFFDAQDKNKENHILDDTGLNETEFFGGYKVKQYDRFRAVTIKNTVRVDPVTGPDGALVKNLVNIWMEQANSTSANDRARFTRRAQDLMRGFYDSPTKTNDAQSYISFDEWIRRIAAKGELNRYKPLIDAILDESKPLDAKTINEFIKVQKNFYYDLSYNSNLNICAPRQIKNAEFVLVPRLVRGTQLEAVAKIMQRYNIDQLNTEETSKAGKCNVLTLWDNDGNIDEKIIQDAENGTQTSDFAKNIEYATEVFNYNYLYTQQETPEHLNAENKAGIQIMKKIIDNIDSSNKYKDKFFKLYEANIRDSFQGLMNDLGVKLNEDGTFDLDEDGNIRGLDFEKLFDMLKDEAVRQNLDSNMMDYFTLIAEGSTKIPATIMPMYMSTVSRKLENMAQALFNNNITRQKLPGFHVAQVTGVGWKSLSDQVSNAIYSRELAYHPQAWADSKKWYSDEEYEDLNSEDKSKLERKTAPYIEVMLPKSNFGLKYKNDDGTLKTDKELLNELQDAGLDMIIGYRIPTEGKQSICAMKVVGFTDDAYGSTIIVPDGWVTQTGSDFDIDSVYGIQYNSYIDKDGYIQKVKRSYKHYLRQNMTKDDLELSKDRRFNWNNYAAQHDLISEEEFNNENNVDYISREARTNELVDCMLGIMTDENSLEENLSRSNFDDITEAKKYCEPKYVSESKKNRSAYNFFDQAAYQNDAMSGANLKAISVNRDTFCSICNTAKATLSSKNTITIYYPASKYNEKELASRFGNAELVGDKIKVNHTMFGWSNDNRNVDGKLITCYTSQTTAHILDAIKEGAIFNENEYTFNAFKTLLDVGSNYETAISFLALPGVTEIVKQYNKSNSIYSDASYNPINAAFKTIALRLDLKGDDGRKLDEYDSVETITAAVEKRLGVKKINSINLDVEKHLSRINNNNDQANVLYDLATVLKFKELKEIGDKINQLVMLTKPDKYGAKQSLFATQKMFDDMNYLQAQEVKGKPIILRVGNHNILDSIYPSFSNGRNTEKSTYPYLESFLKYSSFTSVKVNDLLFPTRGEDFKTMLYDLGEALNKGRFDITEDTYTDYQRYILSYLYNKVESIRYPLSYKDGKFYPNRPTYNNTNDEDFVAKERQRLFGYNCTPDFSYTDNNSVSHPVVVKDLNAPRREEIDDFLKLSPVQKIEFIRANFSDGILTNYITTNLNNSDNDRLGAQTMKIVDDSVESELMYSEFRQMFNNTNPLIKATAIDIIKYAFTVEGFKMRSNGISKYVPNELLYSDRENDGSIDRGIGFTKEINNLFSDLRDSISYDDMLSIRHNFVRQNANMRGISTSDVKKQGDNFELKADFDGAIKIDIHDKNDIKIINKYNIGDVRWEESDDPRIEGSFIGKINSYVRLRFNKKNEHTLYKIYPKYGSSIWLVPINKLEANENSEFSTNSTNNEFPSLSYYEKMISDYYTNHPAEDQAFIDEYSKTRDQYMYHSSDSETSGEQPIINTEVQGENISSKGSELAKKLTNPGNNISVEFRGKTFRNAEHAYQTWKSGEFDEVAYNSKAFKPKGTKAVNKHISLEIMTEIITAKLQQHPELVNELRNAGGIKYIDKSYHEVTGDQFWEKEGNFIKALRQAAINVGIVENTNTTTNSTDIPNLKLNLNDIPKVINGKQVEGGLTKVRDSIVEHFTGEESDKNLYIRSIALQEVINKSGHSNGAVVTINGLPGKYRIFKAPFREYSTYLQVNHRNDDIEYIKRASGTSKYNVIKSLQEDVNSLGRNINYSNVYIVAPEVDESAIHGSTIAEIEEVSVDTIENLSKQGNKAAKDANKKLREINNGSTTEANDRDQAKVIKATAEFVTNAVHGFEDEFKYFTCDSSTGGYLNIGDPRLIQIIRANPAEKLRFLKLILSSRALIQNLSIYSDLNISAEDTDLNRDLQKIKDLVNSFSTNSLLNQAYINFGNEYLAKLSNNPNIKSDLITVFDGYHGTGAINAWVNDLQENGNPLVQVVTKEIMSNVRAAEMQAKNECVKLDRWFKDLEKQARGAGMNIDFNKIVDKNGKRHTKYNSAFVDEINRLRGNIAEASKDGAWTTKAQLAKYEYDKFKLLHTEQPLVDDYYKQRLAIVNDILGVDKVESPFDVNDPNEEVETDERYKGHRLVFEEYNRLREKQFELRSHIDAQGDLDSTYTDELAEVNKEIERLTNPMFINDEGNYVPREEYDPYENPLPDRNKDEEAYRKAVIYSNSSYRALNKYIKAMQALNQKYFKYTAEFGFEDQLNKQLDIIDRFERRTPDGRLDTPMAELMKHTEYRKAKEWIAHNARYVHNKEYWEELKRLTNKLNRNNGSKNETRIITRSIAKLAGAFDYKGTINGTKISDEDRKRIRDTQEKFYQHYQQNRNSDRSLISNAKHSDEIYKPEFYDRIKTNGEENENYYDIVRKINSILTSHYESSLGIVRTDKLTTDELDELNGLYHSLGITRKRVDSSNGRDVAMFISENVDFTYDQDRFDQIHAWAKEEKLRRAKEDEAEATKWYESWYNANTELQYDKNGNLVTNEDGTAKVDPNHFLYGVIKPKEEVKDKWIDHERTEVLAKIHEMVSENPTEYYYEEYNKYQKAINTAKTEEEYNAAKEAYRVWYDANHIFNPYTREMQPIYCWMTQEPNPVYTRKHGLYGEYQPSFAKSERSVRNGEVDPALGEEVNGVNEKYFAGTTASNYKVGTGYDNEVKLNKYEEEVNKKFGDILENLATIDSAKRYIREGFMPVREKEEGITKKALLKEGAAWVGWQGTRAGYNPFYADKDIDFANDEVIDMPMMHKLHKYDGVKLDIKKPTTPRREEYEDDEKSYNEAVAQYEKDLKSYEEAKAKYDEEAEKEHQELMDRNWIEVMKDFITRATRYNVIQDSKYLYYYGTEVLKKQEVLSTNALNELIEDDKRTDKKKGKVVYRTELDTNLQKQYANWGRRLIYDQYKDQDRRLTKIANILQNITSNTYMMMNFKGGIANITQGEIQIGTEAIAREYFNPSDWTKGHAMWTKGIISYLQDMYSDKATTVENALIKYFNIVDFDEWNGVTHEVGGKLGRLRDLAFSPQAMGEHMMQNSVMFAMMHSHRLVLDPEGEANGKAKYRAMNYEEYIAQLGENILKSMLDDAGINKYNKLKKAVNEDKALAFKYDNFRRNINTEFTATYWSAQPDKKAEYRRKFNEARVKAKEEFEDDTKHPQLISQFKFSEDGQLDFVKDSYLAQLSEKDRTQILADFKGRVISVNKKIHGIYDKMGAGMIEKTWYGSLLMQYHKHIYPGLLKHWRRKGYFNEERGTIEKGMYTSLIDFLSLNLRSCKGEIGMTEAQTSAMESIQNIFKYSVDFIKNIPSNWHILAQSERNNIVRCLGEIAGMLSALAMAIVCRGLMDGDDDDSFWLNLGLYEADRMASESMQYSFGMFAESKKLWSSPVAVQGQISDMINAMGVLSKMMLEGDEYDPTYQSGRFAGRNKFAVYMFRRIPIYRQYDAIIGMADSNHYYKLGQNILSFVDANEIADELFK